MQHFARVINTSVKALNESDWRVARELVKTRTVLMGERIGFLRLSVDKPLERVNCASSGIT